MEYTLLNRLEDLLQLMKAKKTDDGLDNEKRRHWALAYTEAEKLYAFANTYLVESEEESEN